MSAEDDDAPAPSIPPATGARTFKSMPPQVLDRVDGIFDALEAHDRDEAERLMAFVRESSAGTAQLQVMEAALSRFDGEAEAALEALERATAREPSWSLPLVEMAGIQLDRGELEAALALAERVLDGWESDDEGTEQALLVSASSLLGLARLEDALASIEALEALDSDDALVLAELGSLCLLMGESERAARTLAAAVEREPEYADAWCALGHAFDELGDVEGRSAAWLRTRELDLEVPRPPWRLDDSDIEALATRTLAELPEEVRRHLAEVPIFVEPAPTEDMVREGVSPRLLGLFSGIPLSEKSTMGGESVTLDACHVFVRNLEGITQDRAELEAELRVTILHETAHFFGLEDHDLEALGLG